MTAHDPAVEAAQRAVPYHYEADEEIADIAVNAAREMARPIRELHKPRTWEWHNEPRVSCTCGLHPWPCATAELIYSTEELEMR